MMNQRKRDRKLVPKLLGCELKDFERVHHHPDGSLVLCKDNTQHMQIHRELDALEACGHKDWRRCRYCGEYDSPDRLYINRNSVRHRKCHIEYMQLYRLRKAA